MLFLVYLNIVTQSIVITDSMFNIGKFLTKNTITFDNELYSVCHPMII